MPKISALTAQTVLDSVSDVLPIVDVSANATEKVTLGVLLGNDPQVRYVTKQGSDSNSGASWGSAKLTVRAGLEALPTTTAGTYTYHYGTVYIGRGQFDETVGSEYPTHVLDMSYALRLIGSGTGPGDRGTRIKLANTQNVPLISGDPDMGSDGHGCEMRDIQLDGNASGQLTSTGDSADTWIIKGGGFGYRIENVSIANSKRWGLQLYQNACNVNIYELNFSTCGSASQGGAMLFTMRGDPSQLTWIGGQIDRCGVECVSIQQTDTSSGTGNMVSIRDVKWENNGGGATLHTRPLAFYPRPSGGGNPVHIFCESLYANSPNVATDTHPAMITEAAGSGIAARWTLASINPEDAYAKAFSSTKTGFTSWGRGIQSGVMRGTEAFGNGLTPFYDMNGVGIFTGSGAPAFTAAIGSLYLRRDGAASTSLYVNTSGSTTWTAK